jgi:hypothetical protein
MTHAQLVVPDRLRDIAYHPKGFDLNGSWCPSAQHILDLTAALSSQSTIEPHAQPVVAHHRMTRCIHTVQRLKCILSDLQYALQ